MKFFEVTKFAVCFEPIERLSDAVYGGLVSALCLLESDEIFALNPFVWRTVFFHGFGSFAEVTIKGGVLPLA